MPGAKVLRRRKPGCAGAAMMEVATRPA